MPRHDADEVRQLAITLRERLSPSGRNRFERAQRPAAPGRTARRPLVSREEVDRVRRRVRHTLRDFDPDMIHGALADLAHRGEASISGIVNTDGRKRRELIADVETAPATLARPLDPPDPDG